MRQSAEQRLHSCEQPPLRIALVASSYNYIKDGVALTLNRLVAYLERQGVEVLVFAPVGKIPAFTHQGTVVPVPLAGMVGGNDRDLQALCDPPCAIAQRVGCQCDVDDVWVKRAQPLHRSARQTESQSIFYATVYKDWPGRPQTLHA